MNGAQRLMVVVATTSMASACIVQRGQKDPSVGAANDYVGAGVFAAAGVGATAVNRKLTGECYAACTPGTACNHATGYCERIACSCPADQVCEIVGGQVVCTQPRRPEGALDASTDAADQ